MIATLRRRLALLLLIAVLIPACATTSLERAKGKTAWSFCSTPDPLRRAGIVIECTVAGDYVAQSDYGEQATRAPSTLSGSRIELSSSYGRLARALRGLIYFAPNSKAKASYVDSLTFGVTYTGTERTVLTQRALDRIIADYSSRRLTPSSRYFVLRESETATAMRVFFKRESLNLLGGTIAPRDPAETRRAIIEHGALEYEMHQQFAEPVIIGALAVELAIERTPEGSSRARLGRPYVLPDDAAIVRSDHATRP